ncbi:hypothetical protein BH683_028160 [Williamsia sp. 1138]|uniref:Uncharacterized protein n=2 Tax=Mycobacteriales TaxID=85007 RepID=A0ABT4MRX4_GORRU|nr:MULTISPECIES: hypothetical protein [Mycobacteriales]MCZ4549756.1 hypothetical protein [Gordonia rubripertincta]OZG25996.1 hypothetical protein BH683_028160 [Williamsia sp. 1138]
MTSDNEEKGGFMYWMTHGSWGSVFAVGAIMSAVMLVVYDAQAAGFTAIVTVVGTIAIFVFSDRPRRRRELERNSPTR